ncbi:MAG: MFS transporter [Ignavibacteriales bacterium]|nr:MFS transporter [Ignavibacteriales bacterium]
MKTKASLTIIFFTVFIDLLGFGLLIPILPTFASKELGITDFQIGLIVASYSFMQFIFNPIIGKYSDRVGRRPIILVTLLITAASYFIFSFAHNFWILLFSRMLGGFGGSNISVAQAYIADITTAKERTKGMGLIGAAFGLGFVFGPLLGGILSGYGYEVVGFTAAGFSLLAFLFATVFLKESIKEKSDSTVKLKIRIITLDEIKLLMQKKRISFFIIVYFIIVFSMANIYGTFAILGYKVYGFTDREIGYLFGIIGILGAIIQGGLLKQLSKRISDERLILWGSFFMFLGLGGLPYGVNFLGVALIGCVFEMGVAVLQPTLLGFVSKETEAKEQGSILGINQSLASLARVLGPLWGGFAYDYLGYQFPFLTGGFFTFLTFLGAIYFFKNNNDEKLEHV